MTETQPRIASSLMERFEMAREDYDRHETIHIHNRQDRAAKAAMLAAYDQMEFLEEAITQTHAMTPADAFAQCVILFGCFTTLHDCECTEQHADAIERRAERLVFSLRDYFTRQGVAIPKGFFEYFVGEHREAATDTRRVAA